jgi:hypothetical protein
MSFIIKLPFRITTWSIQLTEALLVSTPVIFAMGVVVGWFAKSKYGDNLIEGVGADAASLWYDLDSNGDGKVSFSEFKEGMQKRLGKFCPPDSALVQMHTKLSKVAVDVGEGKYDSTVAALKKAVSKLNY